MIIWMEVDLKNKELPLRVADSVCELAKLCGVKADTISNFYCRAKRDGRKCRYVRVEVSADETDE